MINCNLIVGTINNIFSIVMQRHSNGLYILHFFLFFIFCLLKQADNGKDKRKSFKYAELRMYNIYRYCKETISRSFKFRIEPIKIEETKIMEITSQQGKAATFLSM